MNDTNDTVANTNLSEAANSNEVTTAAVVAEPPKTTKRKRVKVKTRRKVVVSARRKANKVSRAKARKAVRTASPLSGKTKKKTDTPVKPGTHAYKLAQFLGMNPDGVTHGEITKKLKFTILDGKGSPEERSHFFHIQRRGFHQNGRLVIFKVKKMKSALKGEDKDRRGGRDLYTITNLPESMRAESMRIHGTRNPSR